MSKTHIPNFAGEWIGQIANHPNKIKFEKTIDSNIWVGMVQVPLGPSSGQSGTTGIEKIDSKWVLMQSVEYNSTDNKLVFTLSDSGRCECYASDYLMTGAYYPAGMATRSAPLGFQLGRKTLPTSTTGTVSIGCAAGAGN